MKKICFVTFDMCIVGGVEQVTSGLCNALVENYEVHLVSFLHTGELKYSLDPRVKYTYFEPTAMRISELRKKHNTTLFKYFSENDIDVAIIQGNYSGYISYTRKNNTKTKIVFADHGAILNQIRDIKTTLARILASRYADKTVTLTEKNLMSYRRLFFVPKRRLTYIYNWIDTSIPHSEKYNADSK
ncbi:MAG: glycosyltransferase, partial [Clostridia bacterium]|nr:glycosyltransferase [Clostridia bacterium]